MEKQRKKREKKYDTKIAVNWEGAVFTKRGIVRKKKNEAQEWTLKYNNLKPRERERESSNTHHNNQYTFDVHTLGLIKEIVLKGQESRN